jgi:hypothetical protein
MTAQLCAINDLPPGKLDQVEVMGSERIQLKLFSHASIKVVGLTHDFAESYAPLNITVSYARQDGTPKPFLMIINWIKVWKDWKIASEIILPVPPAPAVKG